MDSVVVVNVAGTVLPEHYVAIAHAVSVIMAFFGLILGIFFMQNFILNSK